jgi:ATP-binding protein involved in chromosome partitioning
MLAKAVEQFLYEVMWGELDYLLIDLPPGTGDVQLTLAQVVELEGAVVVTTPQNVALMDANRAVAMFQQMKVPVLGVVENMSEFVCPKCGHISHIFSQKGAQEFAVKHRIPILGEVPLLQDIMEAGENGTPIVMRDPQGPVAKAYEKIIERMQSEVERYR